jgi:hypothetical protein
MPIIAKLKHWSIQLFSLWNVILFGERFFIILFERTIKEQFLNVSFRHFFALLLIPSLRDTKLFIRADVGTGEWAATQMDSRPPVILLLCSFMRRVQGQYHHMCG